MARIRVYSGLFTAALLAAAPAFAQNHAAHGQSHGPSKTEVKPFTELAAGRYDPAGEATELFDGLGTVTYPITTANPEAQRYFDQGLRLAYAFNHAEARRAFRR